MIRKLIYSIDDSKMDKLKRELKKSSETIDSWLTDEINKVLFKKCVNCSNFNKDRDQCNSCKNMSKFIMTNKKN
jgi:hypothetical protein